MRFCLTLIFIVIVTSQATNDGNINLVLDTVLEFDGKELDADRMFVKKLQGVLDKIRTVITSSRRSRLMDDETVKLNNFFEKLPIILGGEFDKSKIDVIDKVVQKQMASRHTQDNEVKKLFGSSASRRSETAFNSRKKHSLSETSSEAFKPAKISDLGTAIQNWSNRFIIKIKNMLNEKEEISVPKKLVKIIKGFQDNSKNKILKSRRGNHKMDQLEDNKVKKKELEEALRDPEKLMHIVTNALTSLLFDPNSSWNSNERENFQKKLEHYWTDQEIDEEADGGSVSNKKREENDYPHLSSIENNDGHAKQTKMDSNPISDTKSKSRKYLHSKQGANSSKTFERIEAEHSKSKSDSIEIETGGGSADEFERLFGNSLKTTPTVATRPASPKLIIISKENIVNKARSSAELDNLSELAEALEKRGKIIRNKSNEKIYSRENDETKYISKQKEAVYANSISESERHNKQERKSLSVKKVKHLLKKGGKSRSVLSDEEIRIDDGANKLADKINEDATDVLKMIHKKPISHARSNEWQLFSDKINIKMDYAMNKQLDNFHSDSVSRHRISPITFARTSSIKLDVTESDMIEREDAVLSEKDDSQPGFAMPMNATDTVNGYEAGDTPTNWNLEEARKSLNESTFEGKPLSAETAALYKALEEQQRKYGLDNVLDHTELLDLRNLDINFNERNTFEKNTVPTIQVQVF